MTVLRRSIGLEGLLSLEPKAAFGKPGAVHITSGIYDGT